MELFRKKSHLIALGIVLATLQLIVTVVTVVIVAKFTISSIDIPPQDSIHLGGTVSEISGSLVTLELPSGKYVKIDISNARHYGISHESLHEGSKLRLYVIREEAKDGIYRAVEVRRWR